MDAGQPRSSVDRGFLAGLAGVLSLEAAGVAYQVATGVPVPVITVAAAAFVVACMFRVHGLWGTMAFLALVLAIPYGSEFLGVLTGFPYGTYAYTGMAGPQLFGLVPVFILIAWINISYMAIATTTVAFGRSSYWLAPIDGLIAVAWDVMVDPLAVHAGIWAWEPPGPFYGVPLSNFAGWFLVVTILSLVARAVWSRDARAPVGGSRSLAAILPALLMGSSLAFGALAIADGFPAAAALGNAVLLSAVAVAWVRLAGSPQDVSGINRWGAPRHAAVPQRTADRT